MGAVIVYTFVGLIIFMIEHGSHLMPLTGLGFIASHRLHEYEVKLEGNGPVESAASRATNNKHEAQ